MIFVLISRNAHKQGKDRVQNSTDSTKYKKQKKRR